MEVGLRNIVAEDSGAGRRWCNGKRQKFESTLKCRLRCRDSCRFDVLEVLRNQHRLINCPLIQLFISSTTSETKKHVSGSMFDTYNGSNVPSFNKPSISVIVEDWNDLGTSTLAFVAYISAMRGSWKCDPVHGRTGVYLNIFLPWFNSIKPLYASLLMNRKWPSQGCVSFLKTNTGEPACNFPKSADLSLLLWGLVVAHSKCYFALRSFHSEILSGWLQCCCSVKPIDGWDRVGGKEKVSRNEQHWREYFSPNYSVSHENCEL